MALWSIQTCCLSVLVWVPEIVPSNVQVRPWSVDLNIRTMRTVPALLIPIVEDHAVPSEVQSTVGSELKASVL